MHARELFDIAPEGGVSFEQAVHHYNQQRLSIPCPLTTEFFCRKVFGSKHIPKLCALVLP
jgi:hypothetical protein